MFIVVVLPLLEVERTSLLAISTPSDEGEVNFYTSMMQTKDPNDPSKLMFKVLKISLACTACMDAGRASECTHMEKVSYFFIFFCFFYSVTTNTIVNFLYSFAHHGNLHRK